MYQLRTYHTRQGKDLFAAWQESLRDVRARTAVRRRLNRAALGNLGDRKFLSNGVWELRIDFGPGYRIYYAQEEDQVILLLGGGDKGSQPADIARAIERLNDWKERRDER